MKYTEFGLVNTREMFMDAIARKYAVPAFNIYNMETLMSVIDAARASHSPAIIAVSESALNYMTPNMLMSMIRGANIHPDERIALHLDHGSTPESCIRAIEMGFSSVMIDASAQPFDENIKITKSVADFAHAYNVSVEGELGQIAGIEDENTSGHISTLTNPLDAVTFVNRTGIDSLAVAIGTSHGAYKRTRPDQELHFDILSEIASRMPTFPLVLHGASNIPQKLLKTINEFGGHIYNAYGIDAKQLRRATKMNVCKINVDSDLRLAATAAIRKSLATVPENFNPREYLKSAIKLMTDTCIDEIKNIMGSENKL